MAKRGKAALFHTKERFDSDTEAAEEIVEMELQHEKNANLEQQKREKLIAQTYRMLGRIETAGLFGKLTTVSSLVWLKEVKESKIYKDLPGIGTWESFCNHLGRSRRHIDRDLDNLNVFGQDFLDTVSSFKLGYKDLRKLRKSITDGDMVIDGDLVIIGEEKIPLSPDYKDDLEAAFESIIDERDRQIEERDTKLRAKDRVLEEKERVIQKQEREIDRYERQVKARGLEPGEDNFLNKMKKLAIMFSGLELQIDPNIVPGDATPRMIAAYIETLGVMKRIALAYYDAAIERYGNDDDNDWVQPDLRGPDYKDPIDSITFPDAE